jgi:hypothetical protein
MYIYGHWLSDNPVDMLSYGFIYVITNIITNVKYIGQKSFLSCRGNWKTYTSSSKDVNNDIKLLGKEKFNFSIIAVAKDCESLDKIEQQEQIKRNVLTSILSSGIREYYNLNIHNVGFSMSGRKYKCKARKGKKNTRFDLTVYEFIHTETSEYFIGTQSEFLNYTTIKQSNVTHLIHGKLLSANGWVLKNNTQLDKRKDDKIYNFMNKLTNEKFDGTRLQFRKHTGIKDCYALINGFNKSCQGWVLT